MLPGGSVEDDRVKPSFPRRRESSPVDPRSMLPGGSVQDDRSNRHCRVGGNPVQWIPDQCFLAEASRMTGSNRHSRVGGNPVQWIPDQCFLAEASRMTGQTVIAA